MNPVLADLERVRIVPVIVIDDPSAAVPLADTLCDAGLPCIEITLRTDNAIESLRRIAAARSDARVGAGTVLTVTQARHARDAGATFIVSPGFQPAVVEYCLAERVPVFPGVCTPTEIGRALDAGLDVMKFFPAEPMGGVEFLKAIAGPFTGVSFIPTGGINAGSIGSYLALKSVVACGGSWMAPRDWIMAYDFDRIRAEARRAVAMVSPSAIVSAAT